MSLIATLLGVAAEADVMDFNQLMRRLLALPEQASTLSLQIDHLHYLVISVTMAGWAIITLCATWFVIHYRRGSSAKRAQSSGHVFKLELVLAAGILGFFVFVWLIGFKQYVDLETVPENAMPVYVTAKQWMWKFAYPDGRSSIGVLTVPVGRPVKLVLTSRDVIHSFYVPAFRVKQDAVPGRYTTVWFEAREPGDYDIFCAEFCGLSHSGMLGTVVVLSPADFDTWQHDHPPVDAPGGGETVVSETVAAIHTERETQTGSGPLTGPGMAQRGVEVATRYGCTNCHRFDGQPHIGPSWAGTFGRQRRLTDGRTVIADEAYLTRSMMEPQTDVVAGFAPVMPTYQGLLQPGETAALLELIRWLGRPENVPVPVIPPWSGAPHTEEPRQ